MDHLDRDLKSWDGKNKLDGAVNKENGQGE